MKFRPKYILILLFLTFASGKLFSHSGHNHNYNSESINEIELISEPNDANLLSESGKCITVSLSSCNCCYEGVCFGFDYKCNPYDCDEKEMNCHPQCSQSESGSNSLPATSYTIPKVKVSFSNIKTSEITSVLKSFNISSSKTSDKITLPTYISIQVLLI